MVCEKSLLHFSHINLSFTVCVHIRMYTLSFVWFLLPRCIIFRQGSHIHANILFYLLFGSCCQDVRIIFRQLLPRWAIFWYHLPKCFTFGYGAIYKHTFYFIFYLVLAAKMYHLSVAPAKMFYLLIGEPYACIHFIFLSFTWFLLPRCAIFQQHLSTFSRGAIYMNTFYFIFYSVLDAKMCHLSQHLPRCFIFR